MTSASKVMKFSYSYLVSYSSLVGRYEVYQIIPFNSTVLQSGLIFQASAWQIMHAISVIVGICAINPWSLCCKHTSLNAILNLKIYWVKSIICINWHHAIEAVPLFTSLFCFMLVDDLVNNLIKSLSTYFVYTFIYFQGEKNLNV